jgi:hypothetical protein
MEKCVYPVPGANKYRNMTLQVGGVTKIESIKYVQLKTTDPDFSSERAPQIIKSVTV